MSKNELQEELELKVLQIIKNYENNKDFEFSIDVHLSLIIMKGRNRVCEIIFAGDSNRPGYGYMKGDDTHLSFNIYSEELRVYVSQLIEKLELELFIKELKKFDYILEHSK